jgi:hypothetical protein
MTTAEEVSVPYWGGARPAWDFFVSVCMFAWFVWFRRQILSRSEYKDSLELSSVLFVRPLVRSMLSTTYDSTKQLGTRHYRLEMSTRQLHNIRKRSMLTVQTMFTSRTGQQRTSKKERHRYVA